MPKKNISNAAICNTQIYQDKSSTQTEKDSEKHKNLKEQRKTKRLPWNEKRCAENAKISREIREKNTQHDMKNQ
jgi:hypothetical protein